LATKLYEPPFTDLHPEGLDGLFPDDAADMLVHIITHINHNAGLPT
jgi:type I restriction enzyme R subunit